MKMELDENKIHNLWAAPGFKYSLFGPMVFGLTILLLFAFLSRHTLTCNWTLDGLNNFVRYFAVPLTMMGLSAPITAIFIAHHRSVHQELLINMQGEQNRRSNYFGVYNEFQSAYAIFKDKAGSGNSVRQVLKSPRELFGGVFGRGHNEDLDFSAPFEALVTQIGNIKELMSQNEKIVGDFSEDLPRLEKYYVKYFTSLIDTQIIKVEDTRTELAQNLFNTSIILLHFLSDQSEFYLDRKIPIPSDDCLGVTSILLDLPGKTLHDFLSPKK